MTDTSNRVSSRHVAVPGLKWMKQPIRQDLPLEVRTHVSGEFPKTMIDEVYDHGLNKIYATNSWRLRVYHQVAITQVENLGCTLEDSVSTIRDSYHGALKGPGFRKDTKLWSINIIGLTDRRRLNRLAYWPSRYPSHTLIYLKTQLALLQECLTWVG